MDVEKVFDSFSGTMPDEQIPSIETANEIAREILDAGKPTVKRRCAGSGRSNSADWKEYLNPPYPL